VPSHQKTECLVHQFLASQRKATHALPTHHRPGEPSSISQVHHRHAGTAICEADDISSEAGLDRSVDPKGKNGYTSHPGSKPKPTQPEDEGQEKGPGQEDKEEEPSHPCATILRDSPRTTSSPESEQEPPEPQPHHYHYQDEASSDAAGSSTASSTTTTTTTNGHGQSDQKHWRREMARHGDGDGGASPVPRTPSQLDRRSASADAPNSRLLTKKQLSEMAWGVRELSRRLGSMRLKFRVKTIFLLTKIYDPELIVKTRELCRWLLDREREVRYTVYVDRELRENRRFDVAGLVEEVRRDYVASGEVSEEASWDVGKRLRYWDEEICRARPHTFDFVITLGGDGTVLYASWLFQRIVPPVLSFALGSLGFLTKFDFEDYQKTLTGAFNEGVTVSLRLRFEATVMRSQKTGSRLKADGEHAENELDGDHQGPPRDLVEELIGEEKDDEHTHRPDGTYEVLNEVVVDRGPNPSASF
jgi:NAD+ kinase